MDKSACNLRFFFFSVYGNGALNRGKESMTNWKDLARRKFGSNGYVRGDILRFLAVAGKEFLFP